MISFVERIFPSQGIDEWNQYTQNRTQRKLHLDRHATIYVNKNKFGIEGRYSDRTIGLFNNLDAWSEVTGIGLSLVIRITEAINMHIWVQSKKYQEAKSYFSLPTSQTKE